MIIEDQFRKLKPVFGRGTDKLWLYYLTEDQKGKREIENLLPLLSEKMLKTGYSKDNIVLVPPTKEQAAGEYFIGNVVYSGKEQYPFCLRETDWIQHINIFGRSGCGKTNLVLYIIWNFTLKKKPFMIFDWKRNYRDLLAFNQSGDLLVFTLGRDISPFRFNPLIPPPGTHPETWLKKLVEVISHAYFLGEGVIYLLNKTIDELYREYGVYEGRDQYPTMQDVLNKLLRLRPKGRESLWLTSTIRAIYALCFGEVGKVFCTKQRTQIEQLLDKKVVFELDALTNTDKIFFIEALLLWIYHYRMAEGKRESFKHAIIIEEAHHILLRRKQEIKGEETITDIIVREIRELGESLVIVDQHPSLISPTALGNTFCTIAMNLKHRNDINIMDDTLLLEDKEIINRLPIGYAVVKLQGRYFDPFLVKIPLFPIRKGIITDEHISARAASYFRYSADISAIRVIPTVIPVIPETDKVSNGALQFLKDIVQNPFSPVSERYRRMGLSSMKGNEFQRSLVEKGIIVQRDIAIKNGKLRLFEITEKGRVQLRNAGMTITDSTRHGGIEHRYWRSKVADHLKQKGYHVTEEEGIGDGKTVDIVARKDGRTIALEIETWKADPISNIRKCVEKGFEVYLVVTQVHLIPKLEEKLRKLKLGQRVRIMSVFTLISSMA